MLIGCHTIPRIDSWNEHLKKAVFTFLRTIDRLIGRSVGRLKKSRFLLHCQQSIYDPRMAGPVFFFACRPSLGSIDLCWSAQRKIGRKCVHSYCITRKEKKKKRQYKRSRRNKRGTLFGPASQSVGRIIRRSWRNRRSRSWSWNMRRRRSMRSRRIRGRRSKRRRSWRSRKRSRRSRKNSRRNRGRRSKKKRSWRSRKRSRRSRLRSRRSRKWSRWCRKRSWRSRGWRSRRSNWWSRRRRRRRESQNNIPTVFWNFSFLQGVLPPQKKVGDLYRRYCKNECFT